MNGIPAGPGSYVVGFGLQIRKVCIVGSLGECCLSARHYLYFGSAMGPGGFRARLKHHYLTEKNPHWHIDYLLDKESILATWYLAGRYPQESTWAMNLNQKHDFHCPMKGFGSSDCRAGCSSHLVRIPDGCDNRFIGRLLSSISGSEVTCFEKANIDSEFS